MIPRVLRELAAGGYESYGWNEWCKLEGEPDRKMGLEERRCERKHSRTLWSSNPSLPGQ